MVPATGTRFGEVLRIRWGDVSLEKRTVSITGTLVCVDRTGRKLNKKGIEVAKELVRQSLPKTHSSRRILTLPDWAMAILAYRAEGSMMNDLDSVFPSRAGGLDVATQHAGRPGGRRVRAPSSGG